MKIEITGAFTTYAKAQEVVRELGFAGITGEEVEVITGAEHDTRDPKANSSGSTPSDSKSSDSKTKASAEFSPDAGGLTKQPYPGRTIVIVHSSDTRSVDRIAGLLHQHGAENVFHSGDPTVKMQQDKPETMPPRRVGAKSSGLGSPGVTTGADETDLEARGKEFRTPRK